MERLTYRGTQTMTEDGMTTPSYSDYSTRRIIEKLAAYEDAEEQGLLLRLPCKVGDFAYYVHKEYLANENKCINTIDEVIVDSFVLNVNLFANVSLYIGGDRYSKTLTPYKTLFPTKEEAEQVLKRMESE